MEVSFIILYNQTGAIHHAVGDHDGGNQALNAATRTTVVIASGAAAGIATGGMHRILQNFKFIICTLMYRYRCHSGGTSRWGSIRQYCLVDV